MEACWNSLPASGRPHTAWEKFSRILGDGNLESFAEFRTFSPWQKYSKWSRQLTSPVLQAVKVAEVVADEWRDLFQVVGPNPGCQERLVGVPVRGVHQEQTLVGAHGLGESFGTIAQQHVAETYGGVAWNRRKRMNSVNCGLWGINVQCLKCTTFNWLCKLHKVQSEENISEHLIYQVFSFYICYAWSKYESIILSIEP